MLYERGCTKALQRYKRAISLFSIGAWYLSSLRERQMFWQSTKLILNIKHRQWFRRPADFLPGPPLPLSTQLYSAPRSIPQVYVAVPQSSVLFFATNSGLNRGNLANAGDKLSVVWLRQSVFCHHWRLLLPGGRGLFNFLNILLITFIALLMFKVIVVFKQVGNKFGTREPQAKSCAYKWR